MAFLIKVAFFLAIVLVTQQSPINEDAEGQIRELVSNRQQLAKLRRILNEVDHQLVTLHKRSPYLGLPGAIDQYDANSAAGHRQDLDYLLTLDSPGKRDANCRLAPNGQVVCDAL